MKVARRPTAAPALDPALVPFLDAIAGMLAAEEVRLAESRRALRTAAKHLTPPQQSKKTFAQPKKLKE